MQSAIFLCINSYSYKDNFQPKEFRIEKLIWKIGRVFDALFAISCISHVHYVKNAANYKQSIIDTQQSFRARSQM